jgi:hypothetical protein
MTSFTIWSEHERIGQVIIILKMIIFIELSTYCGSGAKVSFFVWGFFCVFCSGFVFFVFFFMNKLD